MERYKVAFATGSRADYGIVRNYIAKLNKIFIYLQQELFCRQISEML